MDSLPIVYANLNSGWLIFLVIWGPLIEGTAKNSRPNSSKLENPYHFGISVPKSL